MAGRITLIFALSLSFSLSYHSSLYCTV